MMLPLNLPWLWYKPNLLTAYFCSTHRRWSHMLLRAVSPMTRHAWSKFKTVTWWKLFDLPATSEDQHWMVRSFRLKSFLRTISCACDHHVPKFSTERVQKGVLCVLYLHICPPSHSFFFNSLAFIWWDRHLSPAGGFVTGSQHHFQ